MQITIELPNILGEQLKTIPELNDFVVNVLNQALKMNLQPNYHIEDAFGLYKPKKSANLEDMEQAIQNRFIK